MKTPIELWVAVLHALRRRYRRWLAQRLVAKALPRGLPPGTLVEPALRVPALLPASTEELAGDYLALRSGAQAIRQPEKLPPLLLRISALPPPHRPLHRLDPRKLGLDADFAPKVLAQPIGAAARHAERHRSAVREPRRRRLAEKIAADLAVLQPGHFGLDAEARPRALDHAPRGPDETALLLLRPPPPLRLPREPGLSVARPERLGLDEQGLPPAAREPPPIAFDVPAPVRPQRAPRPRTPLARAPLRRFDPRAYRLDPVSLEWANELALPAREEPWSWVHPLLFREVAEVRYLELQFLTDKTMGPEWFAWWHDVGWLRDAPGGRAARDWPIPEQLYWTMQECKEQMLIRRDVPKDEDPPKEQEFYKFEQGVPINEKEPLTLAGMIEEPTWIPSTVKEVGAKVPPMPPTRGVDDAYWEWKTLIRRLTEF